MASEQVLGKIKRLLTLAQSQNPNEAENARVMAQRLIEKHSVTDEELEILKDKPAYGEDEKLYHSTTFISWKSQIAIAIAKELFCAIVQEELTTKTDDVEQKEYDYYVFGDSDDVEVVKFVFKVLEEQVEELVTKNCVGRGPVYINSYCEGLIECIKTNFDLHDIEIKRSSKKEEPGVAPTEALRKVEPIEKKMPTENRTSVSGKDFIKDVHAYFRGLRDGKNLSLSRLVRLAMEAEEKQMSAGSASTETELPVEPEATE